MRAEVKSAHIRALKARFMEKKNCDYPSMRPSLFGGGGRATYGTYEKLDEFVVRGETEGCGDGRSPGGGEFGRSTIRPISVRLEDYHGLE